MAGVSVLAVCLLLWLQPGAVVCQNGTKITDPIEKSSLLTFKGALIDSTGVLQNWNNATDPCNYPWFGIYCDPNVQPAGSAYQHVTEVRLFDHSLGGRLVPELGNLGSLVTLDVMWNGLTGSIPAEIGNLSNLYILALNGNRLTGSIPPELGNLKKMNRIQLDENYLSGPVPTSFGSLDSVAHMHLNNNSLNGSIPKELGQLPRVIHILLDNNNITGAIPPELGNISTLVILQLDNNKLSGDIPSNLTTLDNLTKLSCRDCSLSGIIPDLRGFPKLSVLDLSRNNFNGSIPNFQVNNITTVDLSHNQLDGGIPATLVNAPNLQTLRLSYNRLDGNIPDFGHNHDYAQNPQQLDFQNNSFNYLSLGLIANSAQQSDLDLRLYGNDDVCSFSMYINELETICRPVSGDTFQSKGDPRSLPSGGPIIIHYRLKSPGFTIFTLTYDSNFRSYLATALHMNSSQISVQSYEWQPGPRLQMIILINAPPHQKFNESEVRAIEKRFSNWNVSNSTIYGPYELLGFDWPGKKKKGMSGGAIAAIVIVAVVVFLALVGLSILHKRRNRKAWKEAQRKKQLQMLSAKDRMLKITGVTSFSYQDMVKATNDFSIPNEVGRGGYGKVYRGVLDSGQAVAIKRASLEARQRNSEFYNEIELLSRCHHRNLVALVGYCHDEEEQMLVYEFMENGTLHDNIHSEEKGGLNFEKRVKLALGSAKGILYLHTEASPPIFHRDIKSNNILLDERGQAKVADFGLSKLAPDVNELEAEQHSHVSTVVKGTPGYLDPEYFLTRQLTDKSDVYSFGIVLLELATGLPPIAYGKNIVREVTPFFDNGEIAKIVDPKMGGSYPAEQMDNFMRLALSCVHQDPSSRPTMGELTRTLEHILMNIQGKELRDVLSPSPLGISRRDNYQEQLRKFQDLSDYSNPPTDHSTGSSHHQPQSESNFKVSVHGKDNISPR